jgi:dihydroorotase
MRSIPIIRGADLHSERSRVTPFEGMETVGAPVAPIVRGRAAMRDGQVAEAAGWRRMPAPGEACRPRD